ncbi:hypothetical protein TRICI_006247 [Trichomonascus ciferrii]|uniref:J domain-containing protein n=1 Tax=Trichomonascus ciferrii TaxID=44093 RepID=A0A642UJ92_9ASCO|nr:hypothetical protein TRICI_006247 [Trichomonascus ciferrii]
MSDSRYSYDDNAEVWPYFAITLVGMVLVPSTYVSAQRILANPKNPEEGPEGFKPANYEEIKNFRAKERRSRIFTKSNLVIILGWIALAGLVYVIKSQEAEGDERQVFDPYEILGVSFSATEKQIKSTYRKLSLQLHPDKVKNLVNTTREEIEARYVEITKAYKALTDEVTRENFLKYGHPDGPQQTSHGIALPTFLVEGKGSPIVVSLYAFFVGIVLPWVVGSWWTGARMYTKAGIHQKTAAVFFEACAKEQPHFLNYEKLLNTLSQAAEFELLLPKNRYSPEYIRELLDAHLDRRPVENEADKLIVASRSTTILNGMLDIAAAFKDAGLCQRLIELERCIVQAVPMKDQAYGEYLQLPGINIEDIGPNIENKVTKEIQSVCGKTIPKLRLLKAFFRVPGENNVVPPQSQAHLVIKFAVMPSGCELPEISDDQLEDEDLDNPKILREPLSTNNTDDEIPNVYAPYFPTPYKPNWYGFIVSERDNKLVDGPAELTNLSYQNLHLSSKQLKDASSIRIATFKIQLTTMTPPAEGTYLFKLALLSSGYFGCDIVETVAMKVENPPPVKVEDDEYDISEPEEDSIAGAVEQLRGGQTKQEKLPQQDASSDEEEEDVSDIDTDTDDED